MRALLVLLAALALLLAGCSSSPSSTSSSGKASSGASSTGPLGSHSSAPGGGSGGGSSSGGPTGSPSSGGSGGANHAPVITGFAASVATGPPPLAVNFTFVASDADHDALTWRLAFGDATTDATGSGVNATVKHTFSAVGNYTAKLTVGDGKAFANKTAVIHVASSGGTVTVTGDVKVNCSTACDGCDPAGMLCPGAPAPGGLGCASYASDMPGTDCTWFTIPASADGAPFTVTSTAGDPDIEFWDSCDYAGGASVSASLSVGPESGTIPSGTGCIVAWEFNLAPSGSTITLTYG